MKKLFSVLLAIMLASVSMAAMAEGTLIAATNPEFPPFEYVENDVVVGLDADIAAEIAKDLNMEIKIESMEFPAIIPAVMAGKANIGIAAMTITEERKTSVDFSDPYYNAKQVCIVKVGGKVVDEATLKDALIGVQEGTTGDYAAEEISANIQRYPKALDAVMELAGGKLDAVIVDAPVASNIMAALNNKDLILLEGVEFADEFYGIAVPKGNQELLDAINATVKRIQEDGTLDALIEKYFPSVEAPAEAEPTATPAA